MAKLAKVELEVVFSDDILDHLVRIGEVARGIQEESPHLEGPQQIANLLTSVFDGLAVRAKPQGGD